MAASLRPSMALSRTTGSARAFATTPVPPSRSLLSHNTATRTHTMAIATCTASFLQSTRHLASFSAASPARSCHEKSLHWGRRRSCLVTAASAQATSTDAASFLQDVAAVEPPAALPALLRVLQIQGFEAADPSDRKSIVPLLVPLAKDTSSGRRIALLRWPTPPEGMELPVVSIEEDGTLQLKARSCLEYVNRSLAEEDVGGAAGGTPLASAVGEAAEGCEGLYRAGDFGSSGIPRLEVFLLKKVGPFPDIMEQLALGHLTRGDEVSALVTGEYYASPKHFPGFGRPYIFNSELLLKVGRKSEASDSARIALRSPWWTLGVPYQVAADLAGYGTTLLEYSQERISDEGRENDIQKGKSPGQVALDQSAFLLDVATADGSWDAVRERLAALYTEGGLPEMAKFVMVA